MIWYTVLLLGAVLLPVAPSAITQEQILYYREKVRAMFYHAYEGYMKYAYPFDELRPLSCDGINTWGSFSLTLIDALDTLAVMGNYTEFRRVAQLLLETANFDININVSVFETNIRVVGGLLSVHLLSHRAGMTLEPNWPCEGPFLRLAEDVAKRLLKAFNSTTGMPYGTVNLKYGVPENETPVTCTAGVGTFIVEFGTLSRLTGDPIYEETAMKAMWSLWALRSQINLVGNHINVMTGKWTATDSGIGAGVDSYYEYLVKGAALFGRPELMSMFNTYLEAIQTRIVRDDWHMWVDMNKGYVTLPVFQSLEAFWPGLLALTGYISDGLKSLHNYHQVWKQFGFVPEFYNIPSGEPHLNREGFPLRPEFIESLVYLYKATGDQSILEMGIDVVESIEYSCRTECGYATVKDVRNHQVEDSMESFFLSETTKYLYLLFDPDNFLMANGSEGTIIETDEAECVIDSGSYVFNTEAHPIDIGAVYCCSSRKDALILKDFPEKFNILHHMGLRYDFPKTPSDLDSLEFLLQHIEGDHQHKEWAGLRRQWRKHQRKILEPEQPAVQENSVEKPEIGGNKVTTVSVNEPDHETPHGVRETGNKSLWDNTDDLFKSVHWNPGLMTCPSQPFTMRFTHRGEFFD